MGVVLPKLLFAAMAAASTEGCIPKNTSIGTLKLLDDLDELATLLGTDLKKPAPKSKPKPAPPPEHPTVVKLEKVLSTFRGEAAAAAINNGRLNIVTGNYEDQNGASYKLADALDTDLVNRDSLMFLRDEEVMTVYDAIQHGYMMKTGYYIDPTSGKPHL